MTLAVLIPWHQPPGPVGEQRRAVWDYLRPMWESTGYDLIVGSDPLVAEGRPFSVARAVNNAAAHAPAEVTGFVLFGADHVPDPVVLANAEQTLELYEWCPLYRRIAYAADHLTNELLSERVEPRGPGPPRWFDEPADCPGVLAVRRDLFERVGGMDERFEGWGYEDNAFVDTLARQAPGGQPTRSVLRELWHDGAHRDLEHNRELYEAGR